MFVRFVAVASWRERWWNWLVLGRISCSASHAGEQFFRALLKSIPFVLGIVMLIKAKAVADWISDKLDE